MSALHKILSCPETAHRRYDDTDFLRAAQKDPALWLDYAREAEQRGAAPAAQAHARRVLDAVLPRLADLFEEDGSKGDCLNRSLLLHRLLESAGVWCWVTQGGMTAEFPREWSLPPIGYRPLSLEHPLAHCWVVAPPFRVVDLSLRHQHGDGRAERRMPAFLYVEEVEPIGLSLLDVADASVLKITGNVAPPPALRDFNREFPACRFLRNRIRFRYVPTAVAIPSPPLDQWTQRFAGRSPREIFHQFVAPALSAG
jgi:hypothetical protein